MTIRNYPVAIIGAGPVGLAAAAHLVKRSIPFRIFEAGGSVGANLLDWGHVRVFSPWKYNIDKAAEELLVEMNWEKPDEESLPTGEQLVNRYLLPLSFHPKMEPWLHLSAKVTAITKKGIDKVRNARRSESPFIIQVMQRGTITVFEASAIIDASGTWQNPNPLGAGGIFAKGELENLSSISYRIPDILHKDRDRFASKGVLVVGAGHSAINSLLDLAKLKEEFPDTRLHWALHVDSLDKVYGGRGEDALEARGSLGIRIEQLVNSGQLSIHTPYYIHEIAAVERGLSIRGYRGNDFLELTGIDEIIANTGARPDFSFAREVRMQADPALECVPALAELIDPNVHSCGTVRAHGELELRQPEPNFYVVGVKSYGRAPTFLMATGYEQVRSVAAWLDGDTEAARRVELNLPETGVCSTDTGNGSSCCSAQINQSNHENSSVITMENQHVNNKVVNPVAQSGCCGGAPETNADACCKLDEDKKAEGEAGCGCNTTANATVNKAVACCG